ncbi:MAG TPA: acetyltransferase [Bdellovibrionota bacterium]|jgi:UDP-perosamine 4-acetyltransferase
MSAKTQPIVVIGGGGHAKVLIHLIERLPQFKLLGYVDPRDAGDVLGFSRLGGDDTLPTLAKQSGIAAAIGIGKVRAGRQRLDIVERLRKLGFQLPPLVATSAMVARGVKLAEAVVVMDGAVVQPGCAIGLASIVNTGAMLDHDCVLGADVHMGPRAVLSGNVTVGDGCMVGVGACVIQGIRISPDCTIGAGAAVARDCLDAGTYVGVPAERA